MKITGVFGGTFDPAHLGHLAVAAAAVKKCNLDEIKFIPCYQSPHKKRPQATDEQRINMLELAVADYNNFTVDKSEINRGGISYMIDTLKQLQQHKPLCLIMSMDAFAKFNSWHKWREILQLAHLIIANRPDSVSMADEIKEQLKQRQISNPDKLQTTSSGYIYLLDIEPNTICATEVRERIKANKNINSLVPKKVKQYIMANKIYNPHDPL